MLKSNHTTSDISSVDNSSEIKLMNKFLKKQFPFIIEVTGYSLKASTYRHSFMLDIFVSPRHFCELMDSRVEREVIDRMKQYSTQLLQSIIPEWSKEITALNFRFFPDINEQTILNELPELDN